MEKQMGVIESRFADLIWEQEPIPSPELAKQSEEVFGWKKSTTYTILKRLCDRGFAKSEETVVTSLVPRDAVRAYESERFVERAFGGSLPVFLATFLGGKVISDEEAAELKRLIDQHKEG